MIVNVGFVVFAGQQFLDQAYLKAVQSYVQISRKKGGGRFGG